MSDVTQCKSCALRKGCKAPVPGEGPENAKLVIIGEAPGDEEDAAGRPFVGKAGHILESLLEQLHIPREQVFFTNVVKCKPKDNKTPNKAECHNCFPWLKAEIIRIKPKCIVTLGNPATQTLCNDTKLKITQCHGSVQHLPGTELPVIPVFHPAFLMRHGGMEYARDALVDLKKAWEIAQGEKAAEVKDGAKIITIKDNPPTSTCVVGRFLGFDLEWVGATPWAEDAEVVCASVSSDDVVYYFDREHLDKFVPFLLRGKGYLTGHAISNDIAWTLVHLCKDDDMRRAFVAKKFLCTHILTHLVDHRIEPKNLKHLISTRVGYKIMPSPFKDGEGLLQLEKEDPKTLRLYNCLDSWGGTKLAEYLTARLPERTVHAAEWMCKHVLPATVLATYWGMKIDKKKLKGVFVDEETRWKRAERKLTRLAPGCDLSSTHEVLGHVFGTLGLPVSVLAAKQKWSGKSGQPSWSKSKKLPKFDKAVKLELAKQDKTGFLKTLVRRDRARKFRNTYCENFARAIGVDGSIHPRFVLAKSKDVGKEDVGERGGTKTGRPVMVNPSFQTVPRGHPIRETIVSRFKKGLVCGWDYSQIELRIAADIARCETMLEIFHAGKVDVHKATAREVLRAMGVRKKLDEITDDERQNLGKTPNFSIIYGCSAPKLVEIAARNKSKLSLADAEIIIKAWYRRYPGFHEWQEKMADLVIKQGYIEMPTGEREYIYADRSTPEGRSGIRKAVNAPIQGGASRICTAGFTVLAERCLQAPFWNNAHVMGMVYDSIVNDVRLSHRDRFKQMGDSILTNTEELVGQLGWHVQVPLKVDWKEGNCLQ